MKIPILTYHSLDIRGTTYAESDLAALASDVEQITVRGFRIMPLSTIVDLWLERSPELDQPIVGLSCDDGSDFDFHDLPHPVAGVQRSVLNTLRDFRASTRGTSQPSLSMTSFVIVSRSAREQLDKTSLIGRGWWNDDWWEAAIASGLMEIANHSWDHNHISLEEGDFPGVARGTFGSISTDELADYQISQAAAHLMRFARNPGAALFAYPYGDSNDFLVRDYFPRRGHEIGVKAAFGDSSEVLHEGSSRWMLPRFIYRRDWSSPEGLGAILDQAG
jgi:hypothetical protein